MDATEFKLLRKKAKLTQAELAVLMGVHRETILKKVVRMSTYSFTVV